MRSAREALGVLLVLLAVPAASALPGEVFGVPLPDPAPRETGEVEALADEAAEAAGIAGPSDALPPVAAPISDLSGELPFLGFAGLALAGFGALATVASIFFGGARFSTPAEVLENGVRQRIYAFLRARTGANLKSVTDELHLTTTNAIWHLRKLEEAGLIHSRRFNGYKVFYPAEGGVEARRLSLGKTALQNGNAQEVFEHVVAHPGTHQREIARALGVNHGTVRWHLKKLMIAELITEARRGKASSYEPTPIGLTALREVGAQKTPPAPVADATLVTAA